MGSIAPWGGEGGNYEVNYQLVVFSLMRRSFSSFLAYTVSNDRLPRQRLVLKSKWTWSWTI